MPDEIDVQEAEASTRPFWSGTISFGLVTVPVQLLPAHRSNRTSLRMVTGDGTPLARRYFTRSDDRPLEWDEIVRGYEIEKDRFVVVEDDELERIAPERTRDIDLRVFVDADEVDPMHFERAYYLTPGEDSSKAYRLLAQVMEETNRAGIATFVMRGKEYLVAILAENGILRAETLRFAEEVRTPEDVGLPAPLPAKGKRVDEVAREIEKLATDELDRGLLVDPAAERLKALLSTKLESGEVAEKPAESAPEGRDILDLMQLLQRSLEGKGGAPPADAGERNGASRKDDLRERSKAELYERAQEMDIAGRSSMTKDELIEAIRRSA